MNQGRVWCVVHPTVGLPLLLGSVAVTSLIVHASVMTHTTWMSSYWQGALRNRPVADATPPAPASTLAAPAGFSVSVSPLAPAPGKTETTFVVTVAPAVAPAVSHAIAPAIADAPPTAVTTASTD